MKKTSISLEFLLISLVVAAKASNRSQLLSCEQRGNASEKYYECKSIASASFEIGDNQTWRRMTTAEKFHFESKSPGTPSALIFKSENMLKFFPDLKELSIAAENVTFPYDIVIDSDKWSNMTDNLFYKPGLQKLRLEGGRFNLQRHSWRLPTSLTSLTLIRQNYATYDLERCTNLGDLTIWRSGLFKIPTFGTIMPPLRYLNLSGNPLYEFSVDDIASFCQLEYLSFDYASMGSRHRNCECRRLKKWIKYLNIFSDVFQFEGKLSCGTIVSLEYCREYTLNDAYEKREQCFEKVEAVSAATDGNEFSEQVLLYNSKKLFRNSPSNFLIVAVPAVVILISLSAGGAYVYINYFRSSSICIREFDPKLANMARLTACCCGCSLRTGTASIFLLSAVSVSCVAFTTYPSALILLFFPILGLIGVFEKNQGLFIPFLVMMVIVLVLSLFMAIILAFYVSEVKFLLDALIPAKKHTDSDAKTFVVFYELMEVILLLLNLYFFAVIMSYYYELQEEQLSLPSPGQNRSGRYDANPTAAPISPMTKAVSPIKSVAAAVSPVKSDKK